MLPPPIPVLAGGRKIDVQKRLKRSPLIHINIFVREMINFKEYSNTGR